MNSPRRMRLKIALLAVLTVLAGLPLVDGWSWTSVAMVALLGSMIWREYKRYCARRR